MSSVLKNLLIVGLLSTGIPKAFSSDSDDYDSPPIDPFCGGHFSLNTSALLEVPNNPNITSCEWRLRTFYRNRIKIIFNAFEIDDGDNCMYNYVAVRDGQYDDGSLMGVFCGNKMPPILRTLDEAVTIRFVRSDPTKEFKFSVTLVSVFDECGEDSRPVRNIFRVDENWNFDNACRESFGPTETSGTIKSPCFPGVYPRNKECIWRIEAPPAAKIKLNFSHFNLANNRTLFNRETCRDGNVEVISMDGENELKNHGMFCGSSVPDSIISKGNSMKVIFKSSSTYNREDTGFAADFSHQL